MTRPDARLSLLLQFADTAFPAGGYAHSLGLESYCQVGIVRDAEGVEQFVRAHLEGSAGPCDARAAVAALGAAKARDLDTCRALDETLEAMKPVRELREASRQMGRQTLRLAVELTGDSGLSEYFGEVQAARRPGHHAIALGMASGVLGWSGFEVATVFLYSTASMLVGAALRLLPMGQTEGQRILWRLHRSVEHLARGAERGDAAALWSFTPGLDIQAARHERLESRLFRS